MCGKHHRLNVGRQFQVRLVWVFWWGAVNVNFHRGLLEDDWRT